MSTNEYNLLMEFIKDRLDRLDDRLDKIEDKINEHIGQGSSELDKLKNELESLKKESNFNALKWIVSNVKWLVPLSLMVFYMLFPAPEKAAQAINKATATASSTYVHLRAYDSLTGSYRDIK